MFKDASGGSGGGILRTSRTAVIPRRAHRGFSERKGEIFPEKTVLFGDDDQEIGSKADQNASDGGWEGTLVLETIEDEEAPKQG